MAISATNLGKTYRIWASASDRLLGPIYHQASTLAPSGLRSALTRRAAASYRDFHALDRINFEVRRGEAVGIIGRNGAGKSTLLQIIAGTLQPTTGSLRSVGRIAALLELGAGFNPDFTGEENVYLTAAVLGLSRAETAARFADICAFADIGEFIDQPVKTYSSGMMMRLAFAVNTCVDPDILIVDEALSVGDAPFQAKCFRRLRQLIDRGVTILFVSHDLGTVRSICSRALWLKDGKAEMWGDAKLVAKEYEKFCWRAQGVQTGSPAPTADGPPPPLPVADAPARSSTWHETATLASTHNFLLGVRDPATQLGNGAVVIEAISTTNAEGGPATEFDYDEAVTFHYRLRVVKAVDSDFVLGIRLRDVHGNFVLSAQDIHATHRLVATAGSVGYARVTLRLPLTHGNYIVRTGIFGFQDGAAREFGRYSFERSILWDVREDALHLKVRPFPSMPLVGPVHAHAKLEHSLGN